MLFRDGVLTGKQARRETQPARGTGLCAFVLEFVVGTGKRMVKFQIDNCKKIPYTHLYDKICDR
jgi:hypothetical protein